MADNDEQRGEEYEAEHVHAVYEQIASHFSSTRYKPWPIVERFLLDVPDGSIGLDVGCGNGKYLAVNPRIFIVASDRSTNLTKIAAKHQPHAAVVADNLHLPHVPSSFDFAISIAVVHHLSTPARRVEAVKAILEMLRKDGAGCGKALIYVWALEQRDSRRGWDEGHEQDVMVPWVMKGPAQGQGDKSRRSGRNKRERTQAGPQGSSESAKLADAETNRVTGNSTTEESRTYQRYYHLYRKGELEHDIVEAGGVVLESGYEKDNWWAIAARRSWTQSSQDCGSAYCGALGPFELPQY